MAIDTLLGLDARAYYLSTGERESWGTPDDNGIVEGPAPDNLEELTNVTDVTLGLSKGEADVTTRSSGGWRLNKGTLKESEISFDMIYDDSGTDPSFEAIFNAWFNNSSIALAFLSRAKDDPLGATGLWGDFDVISFEKTEPLEDAQKVSVTVKLTRSAVAPEWVRVPAE